MKDSVKVIEWEPKWSVGAPFVQVLSDELQTYLIYYTINEDLGSEEVAIIEFLRSQSYKFEGVNDEVLPSHPLYKNGLTYYNAHIVENSSWLDEIKSVHKIHNLYNEDKWKQYKHFVLVFHDSVFEIIAEDYRIETRKDLMHTVAQEIVKKLHG